MVMWIVHIGIIGATFLTYYFGRVDPTKQEQIAFCQAYSGSYRLEECAFMRQ